MISIKTLLDMICTEAILGAEIPGEHHFDESENESYTPGPDLLRLYDKESQPPIRYDLELLEGTNGSLYWVE